MISQLARVFLLTSLASYSVWSSAQSQQQAYTNSDTTQITMLGASVSDRRISTDSDPTGAAFKINPADCQLLSDGISTSMAKIDCTDKLESLLGRPLASTAIFSAHTSSSGRLIAETLNCYVVNLQTVTQVDLLAESSGIGFYYQGSGQSGRVLAQGELYEVARAKLPNGTEAVVHEFAAIGRCWAGSMSSSKNWQVQFKPFVWQELQKQRVWDSVGVNYLLNEMSPSFSADIQTY